MTGPEHGILGVVLAHLGFHQRWGWRITAVMGVASLLPDVDALSYLAGGMAFSRYHRGPTHSLGGALALSCLLALTCLMVLWVARRVAAQWRRRGPPPLWLDELAAPTGGPLAGFGVVAGASMVAMAAHLLVDALYPWPMPLLWPLSGARFCLALFGWADAGVLAILLATMFALGIWRTRSRRAAVGGIAALTAYVGARALLGA